MLHAEQRELRSWGVAPAVPGWGMERVMSVAFKLFVIMALSSVSSGFLKGGDWTTLAFANAIPGPPARKSEQGDKKR